METTGAKALEEFADNIKVSLPSPLSPARPAGLEKGFSGQNSQSSFLLSMRPLNFLTPKRGCACWVALGGQLQILNPGCWSQIQEASVDTKVNLRT